MTISMYGASVPVFRRMLGALGKVLDKGAAFAEERKIDQSVLLQSRLAPDMFPLVRQVQIATDMAKGGAGRLAGAAVPAFADEEKTFPELQVRLTRTLAVLDAFSPEQIDGSEDRDIVLKIGGQDMSFKGQPYLLGFVIPNVMFHCTTAYDILRHNGVVLAKRDFLGAG
jgi:uncharacterized protein